MDKVFFFDIDNCLYEQSIGIDKLMKEKIYEYAKKVGLSKDDAPILCERYYKDYGLAIRGLIKHHQIDPIDYDEYVDQSLPLEKILKKDDKLYNIINSLKMEFRIFAFTNANSIHAKRVLNILGIYNLFEGIIYCDYTQTDFPCKPELRAFQIAMKKAKIDDPVKCFLVDDSILNILAAKDIGWNCIHLDPNSTPILKLEKLGYYRINHIHDLNLIFHIFNK